MTKFAEKLNKKQIGVYAIEEVVNPKNGVYEAFLQHDNINENTISVYTGTQLTGTKVQSYILSSPSETPWKKIIKIFADIENLYITYETQGDTVEAEDINKLQDAVVAIETELERHENDLMVHIENRTIDGGSFV